MRVISSARWRIFFFWLASSAVKFTGWRDDDGLPRPDGGAASFTSRFDDGGADGRLPDGRDGGAAGIDAEAASIEPDGGPGEPDGAMPAIEGTTVPGKGGGGPDSRPRVTSAIAAPMSGMLGDGEGAGGAGVRCGLDER